MAEARKDKHGKIILMGNKIMDADGKIWKLQNKGGIPYIVFPIVGVVEHEIPVWYVNFSEFEKVA